MNELVDQLLGYLYGAWRYRWRALAVAWGVCLVGWLIVGMQRDVYEATTRVYVDTTSELRRLLEDQIVASNVEEQLRYVRQSMLGSVQLEKVAVATDLHLKARNEDEMRQLVDGLAQQIQIYTSGGSRGVGDNIYTITYRHPDRQKAVEVVSTLLNTFVEDTLGAQQESSATTREFLTTQIAEYEQRLARAEQRLAEFNRRNYDRLPGMQGGYFERLQSATADLETARQELALVQSRRDRILERLRGENAQLQAPGEVDPNSLEGRLQRNELRLEELLLAYTENHPDVIAVKETINRLKGQLEERRKLASTLDPSMPASNNPVYQAMQISLNEVETEIAAAQADVQDHARRVEELRGLIDEMPDVEAEYARLNRDYDVVQAQYRSLVNSLERERLSRDAQQSEQVEFRIIDPPTASVKPVAPMRLALVPGVLIAGLGIGGALAFLLSQIRPVFQTAGALESAFGVQVVGSIGHYWKTVGQEQRFRSVWLFATGCVGLIAVFSAVFYVEVLGNGLRSLI